MKTLLILLGLALASMPAHAATTTSSPLQPGACQAADSTSVAAIALGVDAGALDSRITYPCGPLESGHEYGWVWSIDGPHLLTAAVAASTTTVYSRTYYGCTLVGVDSEIDQFNTVISHSIYSSHFTFNSGSNVCHVETTLTFTFMVLTTTSSIVHRYEFSMYADEHNEQIYLCNATGDTPVSFDTSADTCTTPHINATVHQDQACGATASTPCHLKHQNFTATADVFIGNQTVDFPPAQPGFNGSVYILLLVFVLALAHLGELHRNQIYRMIAGGILLMASFVMLWELDRLGFNNTYHGFGLYLGLVFMLVQWALAGYLLTPKNYEGEKTK